MDWRKRGEDLPEGYEPEKPQPDEEGKKKLEACASLGSLQTAWTGLTQAQRLTLADIKEACKTKIATLDRAAQKEAA